MSSLSNFTKLSLFRRGSLIPQHLSNYKIRSISTSNKKDDTTTAVGPSTTTPQAETTTNVPKKKYFYDYGFAGRTEEEEHNNMNAMFFTYVTLGFVGVGFFLMYRPQSNMRDWGLREGYLELRRREQLGLPLIDPNYVDPSTVILPSDEDLGDTDIII